VNKNQLRLSIIIPFFNVEKYIAECLDSVYAQDIPESEYEVICVNDCSPDNSREIVLEYQKKHDNLILIEHETNKMLGAARNTGLRAAQGKYVWFIDSDDYIRPNVLFKLLDVLKKNSLQILSFNTQCFNSDGQKFEYVSTFPYSINSVIKGVEFLKNKVPYWKKPVTAWTKIYDREFLLSNHFLYPEGVFFEDEILSLKTLYQCERFMFHNEVIHYYRVNEQSIMNKNFLSGEKLGHRMIMFFGAIEFLENQKKNENVLSEELINYYVDKIIKHKKVVFYLAPHEKQVFYKYIQSIPISLIDNYSTSVDRFFLYHPLAFSRISNLTLPFLTYLRNLKRKLLNS